MPYNKKPVAVFDFDGTITISDTYRDFFIWSFGPVKFYMVFVITIPVILLYLLGFIKNDYPKSLLFRIFFKGWSVMKWRSHCDNYAKYRLPKLIRTRAVERIIWHKEQGHMLVINTASLSDWIKPWAVQYGFDHVIATKAEISDGFLTGNFSGQCSYGYEKVMGLKKLNITKENSYIYAYGDSKGDKYLLQFSDVPSFRSFQ